MLHRVYRFLQLNVIRLYLITFLKNHSKFYQNYLIRKLNYFRIFEIVKENFPNNYFDQKIELDPKEFLETTKIINNAISIIDSGENFHYFSFLHSHWIRGIIFKIKYPNINLKDYSILPPNILFLDLIKKINFKEEDTNLIVDVGTGFGNLLGYLLHFKTKNTIIGLDNFSQISKKKIDIFQKLTFKLNVVSKLKNGPHYIWIFSAISPLEAKALINTHKPSYIFCELRFIMDVLEIDSIEYENIYKTPTYKTSNTSAWLNNKHTHSNYKFNNEYELDLFNEIVIVLKRKNVKPFNYNF